MELIKRLADPWWRICNLYMVRDEEARVVPFFPRIEQEQFYHARAQRNFILKARKLGMSTLIILENFDACVFEPGMHAAIVDRTQNEAQDKLDIARLAWKHLDKHPNSAVATVGAYIKKHLKLTSDTHGEIVWTNGSRFEAGVSLRGGTPQRLHVSELGYIASHDRKRAQEIKAGSINAVPQSGFVTIETTHEGGKVGLSYELAKLAMDTTARGIQTPLDWMFHFFPWFEHPSYRVNIAKPKLSPETVEYFRKLKEDYGYNIGPDRQAWYEAKAREQREAMFREFPSTPDEAFRAQVSGAIYPAMMTLRANGRISKFEHDRNAPLFAFWDIGVSDYTSIWLVQFAGREILWLAWHEGEGAGVGHYAEVLRAWERQFGKQVAVNFLPHDANTREKGSGKTYVDFLIEAGFPRHSVKVVPRCPDVWQGINHLRDLLPRSWFHVRCDEPRQSITGIEKLSGVGCLEAYHVLPQTSAGVLREMPAHDESSHSADAARTMAEAWHLGMIDPRHGSPEALRGGRGRVKVETGLSDE